MKSLQFLETVYVFNGKSLSAILKKQGDGTLEIQSCNIEVDELKSFLTNEGYAF